MQNIIKLAALFIIATIGAFVIRALFVASSGPSAAAPPPTVRVRAAADDLPDGLLLRDSDLVWKTMPRSQAPASTLLEVAGEAGTDQDLKGDLLRHAVRAGTPLGTADVILPSSPGFLAAALKPGMRAISVAVDDVSGNAGLIQPGDYVDVLLTQQIRADGGVNVAPARAVESETVAERVRVLAVGSAFRRPKEDAAAPSLSVRTATFEVTPMSAQAITVAAHLGTLSLALRSFATRDRHASDLEDVTHAPTPPVWAGDVSRGLRELASDAPRRTSVPAPHVTIYRGASVEQAGTPAAGSTSTDTPGLPPLPSGMPHAARTSAADATGTPAAGS
ncbi:Flp pilus assembly protein CpaB [Paraburkholderia sp. 1N]|uniref:Flp pilus assembly protein CpaB n=1 Tax=Paraburkholderia solitsugae TaxID=2675748 RepID=A0ABX2BVP0_9BURK|nr:Flp pilus assembly protein CpaB [Paraburkholderia solitsugae]NPT44714.1 Flp pilus assembly protein CpaB [Paraburkholderia solitsugae]